MTNNYRPINSKGLTLVEIVLTVIIISIIVTVSMRSALVVNKTAKVEETKAEMEVLAIAILGNETTFNNGVRNDFGYVGDVGALPPNLDALLINPGGYATWRGPYVKNSFQQVSDDYKRDDWGTPYVYSGGLTMTSSGSGTDIVRKLAAAISDITNNQVSGNVLDRDGTPPGVTYRDSVVIRLTIPNGLGGTTAKSAVPDAGGYFEFDSIPIGNHDAVIVYQPTNDTLKRFVSVPLRSSIHAVYHFVEDLWQADTTSTPAPVGIVYVSGSAAVSGGSCNNFEFDITNTSPSQIIVSSITLEYPSPTAYYRRVRFKGQVFNSNNPRHGTGELTNFSSSKTINPGEIVTVSVTNFRTTASGTSSAVDMSNADMTITFSDGSVVTFNTGGC